MRVGFAFFCEDILEGHRIEFQIILMQLLNVRAKRLMSYENRISELINSMSDDTISIPENELLLKTTIFEYTKDPKFMKSKNMGEILKNALEFVKRNYETENTEIVF